MWFNILLLLLLCTYVTVGDEHEDPVLYYYGLEESERSLPSCGVRQACSALVSRAWAAPAHVRLCRCTRRRRCDAAPATHHNLIQINNRVRLQFCQPINDWPECAADDKALTVVTSYERMNPDELEEKHHLNIQLVPPTITFKCRCQEPNYWKLASQDGANVRIYQCTYLPLCMTGEFCGNYNSDLYALYQSCQCPRHHICVHNGGVPNTHITELLYEGKGWKAYCQRVRDEDSYEEY